MAKRLLSLLLVLAAVFTLAVPAWAESGAGDDVVIVIPEQLAAPKLLAVSSVAGGVKVSWSAVFGASMYRVFYNTDDGWKKAGDTADTSYIWSGARSGMNYAFTVRCLDDDGKSYTSSYDKTGLSLTYTPPASAPAEPPPLETPRLLSAGSTISGVQIEWTAVPGASMYRVFCKNGDSWKKIADTAAASYTWTGAKSGTNYTFTVRCLSADGKSYTSSYDKTGLSLTYKTPRLETPRLLSVSSTASGVQINWAAVPGASMYRVFYKNGDSWKRIADTADTSYVWSRAKSGTDYTFTVRCLSVDGSAYASGYDKAGISIQYQPSANLAAPVITSISNAATGVQIKWTPVAGADKYRVFYKNDGRWEKLGDTAAASYIWTGASSGTKYTFTVRCLSADSKRYTSAYDKTGKSITYLAAPKLSAAANTADGVQICWEAVPGASMYRVFRKNGDSWKKIADTTATSYTWAGAQSGTNYTFTVRCVNAGEDAACTSAYDKTGISVKYLAAPQLIGLTNTGVGVCLSWQAVPGAEQYRVFYKNNGTWIRLADTAFPGYLWTGAKSGADYTFTVRCLSADGKSYTSAYSKAGRSIHYQPVPSTPDVVKTALTQLGNVGGRPYWSWWGYSYRVPWCAIFVSWCADRSGDIDAGITPMFENCPFGSDCYREKGLWRDRNYRPSAGDIIFFDWEHDGVTDHVGIVEHCENGIVFTVEGNSDDKCREKQYYVGSLSIYGYGIRPY